MAPGASAAGERNALIDALRGVALLAMIVTHMVFWYGGALLPDAVYGQHQDVASRITVAVNGWLVLGKALLLFAFLFGLGFQMQMERGAGEKSPSTARYAWRLVVLGAIGLAHHALWRGDILTAYALLGFLLLPARRLGTSLLVAIGACFAMNLPHRVLEALAIASGSSDPVHVWATDEAARYYAVLAGGSLLDLVRDNWSALASKHQFQFLSGRLSATFGFLLLGMVAGRQRWFDDHDASRRRLLRICRGSAVALVASLLAFAGARVAATSPGVAGGSWNGWLADLAIGSCFDAALILFYVTGAALLLRGAARRAAEPLAAVGRMALSSYFGQTLAALVLFPAFGLGFFAQTTPFANVFLALAAFALQTAFAEWWLLRFRFGPIEWAWRSLTYLRFERMRHEARERASSASVAARRIV